MCRKSLRAIALILGIAAISPHACVQIGANFWNLGWQGIGDYCTGGTLGNWSATFKNEIQVYSVLRFMDWNMVNNIEAGAWANRVKKSDGCTQCSNAYRPLAYEWMIDVVNMVPGCGFWLNVPTRADSVYVTSLAQLVHTNLGAGHKIYLEYANETWWEPAPNPYVVSVGKSIPGISADAEGICHIGANNEVWIHSSFLGTAYLSFKMWSWFRQGWAAAGGDPALLVNVLAGMVYGGAEEAHGMLEAVLDTRVNTTGLKCDMFVFAPYWEDASGLGMEFKSGGVKDHYDWCQKYGVKLGTYEGGPGQWQKTQTPAAMTAHLAMLDKYLDGPYMQYCHSGGSWGATNNGYYSALADWANSHQCNPVFTQKTGPVAVIKTDKQSGSLPLAVSFDGSQSTGTNLSYAWNFGDGATSTVQKPQHTFTTAGSFTVKLRITDASASDSVTTVISVIDPSSEPAVRIINDATIGSSVNQFDFSGTWSAVTNDAYNSDEHWSADAGSAYTVRFYGAQVKLYGTTDVHHGIATVSMDGGTAVNVDFYSATRAAAKLLWTSPTLTKGNHTIVVTNSGRKNAASSGTVIVGDRVDVFQSPDATTMNTPRLVQAKSPEAQSIIRALGIRLPESGEFTMTILSAKGVVIGAWGRESIRNAAGRLAGLPRGVYFVKVMTPRSLNTQALMLSSR